MDKFGMTDFNNQKLFNPKFEEIQQELADKQQELEEKHTEKFLQISKAIYNPMADIPEQKMLIILIDIVGFSKSNTRQQVYDIYLFQRFLISEVLTNHFDFSKKIKIANFVPTGDGCYIVAEDCEPDTALNFLVTLMKGYNYMQKDEENTRSLRISAEFGSVVPIIDIARHKNYIGEGMNETARILTYGQQTLQNKFISENPTASLDDAKIYSRNSLYLGDSFLSAIKNFESDCDQVVYFEKVPDKHGRTRNVTVMQGIREKL